MRRSLNLILLVFVVVAVLFVGGCSNDTNQFILTIHVQGEGSVEPVEGKHRFDPKAVVDLTATPSIGWSFKEWIGEVTDTGAPTTTILMDRDKEIIAVFEFPTVDGPPPGEKTSHTVNGVDFNMRLTPASTFPTGTSNRGSATVEHDFWVAETQVTYELWYEVRMWALDNGYTFANAGREGGDYRSGNIGGQPTTRKNEPVTMVSWYDSIVWCNALSQMLGYDPVYTRNGVVIKSAWGIDHTEVVAENRNGFRLPTSMEWELAARYKGSDSSYGAIEYPAGSGNYWTPGNYASGATADYNNAAATQEVAWYKSNSDGTKDVGLKRENGLGIFDMSGNVREWCFTQSRSRRVARGGGWNDGAFTLHVGFVDSFSPDRVLDLSGLRFLRTQSIDPPLRYTLTMQKTGQGYVEPDVGDHTYNDGVVVNLKAASKATPEEDWRFSRWEGDVFNPNALETKVTMDDNKTVRAVFEEIDEYIPGEQISHNVNGVGFNMRLAPASTFPTNEKDKGSATVEHDFWVAETQVTYELWYEVRMWALDNGYTFANAGREGGDYRSGNIGGQPTTRKNEPVTMVSWYDSIVCCNALSQMLGYDPVYTWNGVVIKSAWGIDHTEVVAENRNGFRLPTSMEWELAARYKGSDSSYGAIEYPAGSGNYWTPGNYASGATGPAWNPTDEEATKAAAWYYERFGGNTEKTQDVGQKPSGGNGLGLYDMSGNVWEWCFTQRGSCQVSRGGGWFSSAHDLPVSRDFFYAPGNVNYDYGLRFLRMQF